MCDFQVKSFIGLFSELSNPSGLSGEKETSGLAFAAGKF